MPTGWSSHAFALPLCLKIDFEDAPGVVARIADHHDADAGRAFDLRLVAAELLAMAAQGRVALGHVLDAAAEVARVGVARHELERDVAPAAAHQDRAGAAGSARAG